MVGYEKFREIELKVARIQEVTAHPNADGLYVLKVGFGDAQKADCGRDPQFL